MQLIHLILSIFELNDPDNSIYMDMDGSLNNWRIRFFSPAKVVSRTYKLIFWLKIGISCL
jgi:hypothetical protein